MNRHKTFIEFLTEAKLQLDRARLQPIPKRGTSTIYDPNGHDDSGESYTRGIFPVVRAFNSKWENIRKGYGISVKYVVLLEPEPIVVDVLDKFTAKGRRLAEVEFVRGGDQPVAHWNDYPFKKMRKRKGWREDPNFYVYGEPEPLINALLHINVHPIHHQNATKIYVMQKDLKY